MKSIKKYLNPLKAAKVIYKTLSEEKGWKKLAGLFLVYSRLSNLLSLQRNGYKLHFFPTALSVTFFQHKDAWRYEEIFLERYMRPNDVIIDVGANIGNVGIRAATLFDSSTVYMIEAHPSVFQYMVENIKFNHLLNVKAYNYAIGNSDLDSIQFSNHLSDDMNAVLNSGDSGIRVQMRKLDSLVFEKSVDFLKIDVEGFELEVFKGASRLLEVTSCILFESWDEHFTKYNTSSPEVLQYLRHRGFSIYTWKEDSLIELNIGYSSQNCENLLAIKNIFEFKERMKIEH